MIPHAGTAAAVASDADLDCDGAAAFDSALVLSC